MSDLYNNDHTNYVVQLGTCYYSHDYEKPNPNKVVITTDIREAAHFQRKKAAISVAETLGGTVVEIEIVDSIRIKG